MPRTIHDWAAIQAFYDLGNGFVECQKRFGFTHTAWNKAISRGSLLVESRPFKDRRRRYDWSAVQRYYDEGHTYRECREKFGFAAQAWTKAVRRGELKARARVIPIHVLLANSKSRKSIKYRLLEAGILTNRCVECGIAEWRGRPLSIHIDHINGVKDDHRLENLRMLCPNCHSQTHTYGGRNAKNRKRLQEPDLAM